MPLRSRSRASSSASTDSNVTRALNDFEERGHVDDPRLDFLIDLYPDRDRQWLRLLLAEHGDVEKVVDALLSEDYIAASHQSDVPKDATPKLHQPKKKKQTKQTYSLTSNIPVQQGSSSSSKRSIQRGLEDGKRPVVGDGIENPWVKADSVALRLGELLDTPPGDVASMYHKRHASFALTLETFILAFEQERPFDTLQFAPPLDAVPCTNSDAAQTIHSAMALDSFLDTLTTLFPDSPSSKTQWKRFLCAANGNIHNAIELMQLQAEFEQQEGTIAQIGLLKGHSRPASPVPNTQETKVAVAEPPLQRVQKLQLIARPTRASHAECRLMAEDYREQKRQAFAQAARHFQQGKSSGFKGAGDRGAATYWAERGREMDAKARQWDLRAAQSLVQERQILKGPNEIDLHGLNTTQALTVVKEGLNTWWSSPSQTAALQIIVGAGKHSANGTSILFPVVDKYLQRENWRYRKDKDYGIFYVTGLIQ